MLGSLDFHRYTGNIVKPGFCFIQFIVTFADDRKIGVPLYVISCVLNAAVTYC